MGPPISMVKKLSVVARACHTSNSGKHKTPKPVVQNLRTTTKKLQLEKTICQFGKPHMRGIKMLNIFKRPD
jgi:hypothetical protein